MYIFLPKTCQSPKIYKKKNTVIGRTLNVAFKPKFGLPLLRGLNLLVWQAWRTMAAKDSQTAITL
jgi:hypothetical protein